ncbi:hypothetical protein B0H13DRAFT_1870018 [Mycena leptocephala]|nr:hypothetical protein B0H13DRAFT_1870018 [Mycena leptocephala]
MGNTIPALQLGTLGRSILFRVCSMWTSTEKLYKQRFNFFGGCPPRHRAENPFRFLLGWSVWKPLVRGESEIIEVTRGVTLIFLSLGLPVFAVYTIIFVPAPQSQVEIRSLVPSPNSYDATDIEIGIQLQGLPFGPTLDAPAINVTVDLLREFVQPSTVSLDLRQFPTSDSTVVHVYVGEGISEFAQSVQLPYFGVLDVYSEGNPLHVTGRSLGILQCRPHYYAGSSTDPVLQTQLSPPLVINQVHTTQPDPSPPDTGPQTATLRLIRLHSQPSALLQEFDNTSVIAGISTVGGFWTLLNGTFVFLFGANVLYFLFACVINCAKTFQQFTRKVVNQARKRQGWLPSYGRDG